jgi:SDR family mycofactocin-dependent oxidoreductase
VRLAAAGRPLLLVDACGPQAGIGYPMPTLADLEAVSERCTAAGSPWVGMLEHDVADGGLGAAVGEALGGRPVGIAAACAGVISGADAWSTADEAWDTLIGVNLGGVRRLAEATVPAMIEAREGRFVAIASAAALRAMPMLAAYSAAKAGVVAYTRALAADLAGTGVTANAICPGSTRGPMLDASATVYDLPDDEAFAVHHFLRRLLDPDEIAAAVAWVCSAEAGALTGAVLPVDGGLSA